MESFSIRHTLRMVPSTKTALHTFTLLRGTQNPYVQKN